MAIKGLVLLAKDTFSAVSTVSFDNVFSNTYKQYQIIINATGSTTNVGINCRGRTSGSDYSTASYSRQQIYAYGSTAAAFRYTSETSWAIGNVNSSFVNVMPFEILNPYQSTYTSAVSLYTTNPTGTGSIESGYYAHGITVTNSFDGITIFVASGTMTGSIMIYGLAQ